MATSELTAEAQELLGGFVERAGKTFLVIRCSDVFGQEQVIRITPSDLAEFYATQANNISSGCRVLAGLAGDWRQISDLAQACLCWFKTVNIAGIRRAGRKFGLEPKF